MLTNHMLYDLSGLFMAVRSDVKAFPAEAFAALADVFCRLAEIDNENVIRATLRKYDLTSMPALRFITVDNVYAHRVFYNDQGLHQAIADILHTMDVLRTQEKNTQLYDFVDAIHFFPLLFTDDNMEHRQRMLDDLLEVYRKKWKVGASDGY